MNRTWTLWLAILLIAAAVGLLGVWLTDGFQTIFVNPEETGEVTIPSPATQTATGTTTPPPTQQGAAIETVAEELEIPWELVFLPDGEMLVTERPGRLLKIGDDKTVIPIAGVRHVGEGGLLGLALHPDFAQNNQIYLYLTTQGESGLTNRVERYELNGTELTSRTVIIKNIPGSQFHDGGRIAFGPTFAEASAGKPDKQYLFITTGDAGNEPSAQDTNSLAGKILRLNDDGSIPADNPFTNAVYSYGHRNPQGLAWDEAGGLWATEHGRSGLSSGFDEVNLIEPGANYGWPEIQGNETQEGMRVAAAHSGSSTTWAPSGGTFLNGNLFFAGLRGEALYEAKITANKVAEVVPHFSGEHGRLRTATIGPDGMVYILTNNRDGRGTPQANDDRIIRVNPTALR